MLTGLMSPSLPSNLPENGPKPDSKARFYPVLAVLHLVLLILNGKGVRTLLPTAQPQRPEALLSILIAATSCPGHGTCNQQSRTVPVNSRPETPTALPGLSFSSRTDRLQRCRLSLASRSDGNSDLAPPSASQPHCGMQNDINEGAEEACPRIQVTLHFSV